MRPGAGPMPNFFMPLVQQGQQGQLPGGRRGGPPQQNQQQVPMMQQQVVLQFLDFLILFIKYCTNHYCFFCLDDAKRKDLQVSSWP